MTTKRKTFILIGGFCLGGCIALAIIMMAICFSSWTNTDGIVTLDFNHFNERLIESILFPIYVIGGTMFSIYLIKNFHES